MTPMSVGRERRGAAPHPGPLIVAEYIDALGVAVDRCRCRRAARTRPPTPGRTHHAHASALRFRTRASGGFPRDGRCLRPVRSLLHALWRGDRLRVYESNGTPIWHGLVLTDLDGRVLIPFVRTDVWRQWFAQGRPADLWIGPKHASCFERMHANAEETTRTKKKSLARAGLLCCNGVLNVGRAADDHFARRAHPMIFIAMCIGGGDECILIGAGDARSAKRTRNLFRHDNS